MAPEVWEDAWGDLPEDGQIEREIIWWELTGPRSFRIHPAVRRFVDLAVNETGPGSETDWDSVLERKLRSILDRTALVLQVPEEAEHIDLAEDFLQLATTTNSEAVLDVVTLINRWSRQQRLRLEEAASRGRYWFLARIYDLVAFMPDRITGKVRRRYYQLAKRPSSRNDENTRFIKDHVILMKEPRIFQVANAVYQDQAAGMEKIISFLGCLLEDAKETLSDRYQVLREGLALLGLPVSDLETMDVRKAFQHLFQGFSLPADLIVGERSFLGSIGSGDPEVLRLIRSLQSYFESTTLDPYAACEVVLISDDLLLGRSMYDAPMIVASKPSLVPLYEEARLAARKARAALAAAIEARGTRHTRKKIQRGSQLLDRASKVLAGNPDSASLRAAILDFEEAERIYLEAKETSWRKEHSKPKLRVHDGS